MHSRIRFLGVVAVTVAMSVTARHPVSAVGVDKHVPVPSACRACWRPPPHTTWQWQLSGRLDMRIAAAVYDIDMFDSTPAQIAKLHRLGRRVVCYVDAGSWESWRPDAERFPKVVRGKKLQGWPGERWLDIRRLRVLQPIIRERVRMCKRKGFDGIEFDNVDGYENDTGFPLTSADQLRYNMFLANLAHASSLAVALKNDTDQVAALQPYFDWSLDEQCFQYRECVKLLPFIRGGKSVFEVEYNLPRAAFCPKARQLGFNAMRKQLNLGPWLRRC